MPWHDYYNTLMLFYSIHYNEIASLQSRSYFKCYLSSNLIQTAYGSVRTSCHPGAVSTACTWPPTGRAGPLGRPTLRWTARTTWRRPSRKIGQAWARDTLRVRSSGLHNFAPSFSTHQTWLLCRAKNLKEHISVYTIINPFTLKLIDEIFRSLNEPNSESCCTFSFRIQDERAGLGYQQEWRQKRGFYANICKWLLSLYVCIIKSLNYGYQVLVTKRRIQDE